VALLQEAGGLLKIEDILPFFPDFVVIDHFQVGCSLTCVTHVQAWVYCRSWCGIVNHRWQLLSCVTVDSS
jgi:hypothetical protein